MTDPQLNTFAQLVGQLINKAFDDRLPKFKAELKQELKAEIIPGLEEFIKDQVGLLPSREEFFTKEAELMGELKAIRDEKDTLSYQVINHSDRLEKIESKLGIVASN